MRGPSAALLLDVWEKGLLHAPAERMLSLLAAATPETSAEALAELGIGERDARLLQIRRALFGSRLPITTGCPACMERLEWESVVADLLIHRPEPADGSTGVPQDEAGCLPTTATGSVMKIVVEDFRIRFRLPNGGDMVALSGQRDVESMRKQLLDRCLIEALAADGTPLRAGQLPEGVLEVVIQEMERRDPQANLQIELSCAACGHCWEAAFDIGSFLWAEIDAWAKRTLRAVDLLARTYGWREADILAMSPSRRQLYLEMASQ